MRHFAQRKVRPYANLRIGGVLPPYYLADEPFGKGFYIGQRLLCDLFHHFLERVAEARHMDAGVRGIQLGKEIEVRIKELNLAVYVKADDASHIGYAHAAQDYRHGRTPFLHVLRRVSFLNLLNGTNFFWHRKVLFCAKRSSSH